MRRAFASVYLAAALSFGAGVLRDWLLVSHVPAYQQVFGAMYAVALAASFSVNALTLGQGFHRHPGRMFFLLVLSVVLLGVLVGFWQPLAPALFWWVLPVPAMYVVGALYARRLLDAGHVLVGRLRDGVASAVMALLILAGLQAASLPLAVLAGTVMVVLAARALPAGFATQDADRQPLGWRAFAGTIFYSNIASVMVNAWALSTNNAEGQLFGHPVPVVVRVSVYAFQLLSLPSVLLTRWRPGPGRSLQLRVLTWGCIALAALAAVLPTAVSVLAFPLAALATLYASVLLMGQRHGPGGSR